MLVVAVLYWAQAVLVPIAPREAPAFLLTPVVEFLERWVGRVPSVLAVVALSTALVALAGWGLFNQATSMVDALPEYRTNIRHKIADVRWLQHGGTVEKLQQTVDDIKHDMGTDAPAGTPGQPVVVASEQAGPLGLGSWIGPIVAPLANVGLVVARHLHAARAEGLRTGSWACSAAARSR